jgi:uncharacterized membrane protein
MWTVFFLALIWLAFNPSVRRRAGHLGEEQRESVEEALRRRFALGEIDEEEFDRKMRTIRESRDRS